MDKINFKPEYGLDVTIQKTKFDSYVWLDDKLIRGAQAVDIQGIIGGNQCLILKVPIKSLSFEFEEK